MWSFPLQMTDASTEWDVCLTALYDCSASLMGKSVVLIALTCVAIHTIRAKWKDRLLCVRGWSAAHRFTHLCFHSVG